jgi:hypothetical protein
MRAREWVIASLYRKPEAYGIPALPEWRVERTACGGVAFAAPGREPFIAADRPVTVRR